jgi:3-dehydroquinate dehydratase/shikimate dehydrogenase
VGWASRVLAPAFGSLYTYAAPRDVAGTAAGQIRAQQLRTLYRAGKLTRAAKIFGVIADPIGHSLSPVIHNRAFQTERMDAVYLPFHVPAGQVSDFRRLAEQLPVCGFSVTIPHKQRILRQLDWIDPLAKRIGAVNTVWRKAGKWRGANTDVAGMVEPLKKRVRLSPRLEVLIAGNGGAARAAAFALRDAGCQVSITGRNCSHVQALARATGTEPLSLEQAESREFDVVVHATPMGMHPDRESCFFRDRIPASLVFDMVYNPLETELLKRARAQGCVVIQGYEMFLEQAVRQFEIWTGDTAPRAAMEKAVLEALQPVE